jgi:hypothetical protein
LYRAIGCRLEDNPCSHGIIMGKFSNAEKKAFFRSASEDHRKLMRSALEAMGKGDLVHALHLATSIRVLMHETGNSVPILKRLRNDYESLQIRAFPTPDPKEFLPSGGKMMIMSLPFGVSISGNEPISLNNNPDMGNFEFCTLGSWWRKRVLKVPGCDPLSQRDVVLGVANKEGAHADDDMTENYRRVLGSQPIRIQVNDEHQLGPLNVTRFTVGQAGIELLDFLDRYFPHP